MKKIGILQPDQAVSEFPSFFEKKSIVRRWIKRAEAVWIVPNFIAQKLRGIAAKTAREIREETRGFFDGPIGIGMLVPFVKPRSSGDKLHYEMPMAGHRTPYQRSLRRLIHVSHRSLFSKQAIA